MKYPRGTDTSYALTEVRTVLSRAETAASRIESARRWNTTDPEGNEMISALAEVVKILDRWRRTGRK